MSQALLEICDLKKSYLAVDGSTRPVVDMASFSMAAGEQWALQGRSGSGKTTLLHLVAGILKPDSGRILLQGQDLASLDEAERDNVRAHRIGYIFQTFNLLQGYSALENVMIAMSFGSIPDLAKATALLSRVGLGQRLHDKPSQLSTGQQQRVAVARALCKNPSLVLADEPTGNLDEANAGEVLALIRQACKDAGAGLLLVSHDSAVIKGFSQSLSLGPQQPSLGVAP
jgi:ABC-type lipoprotein export system ATPase subunit